MVAHTAETRLEIVSCALIVFLQAAPEDHEEDPSESKTASV